MLPITKTLKIVHRKVNMNKIVFFLLAIFYSLCCGITVWIEEKWKPCKKSPTGLHEWETVEEDRIKWPRGDWGCVPGDYCKHCEIRKDTEKRIG